MKTLHTYLTRQILASLLLTVLVFTFVLLLGNAVKDLIDLLRQVSFGVVARAFGLLVPWVWVFALPMGMLTATLLIFGRFSADQEYTAVRASGISLISLVSPILLLSLALCGVSALVNLNIGPRCRVAYTSLRFRLGAELAKAGLPEGQPIRNYPGYILYVGKNRSGNLSDITVFAMTNETTVRWMLRAPRGKMDVDIPNKQITLKLFQSKLITLSGERGGMGMSDEVSLYFDIDSQRAGPLKPNINDMTFAQLQAELMNLEQLRPAPLPDGKLSAQQQREQSRSFERQRQELLSRVRFQLHRQVAFSFACFGFTLIGIPLGIRMHRRETNIGIAVALLLATVYYSFILIAQALDTRPEYAPQLIVWFPNFLFQTVGAVLLWRANRG